MLILSDNAKKNSISFLLNQKTKRCHISGTWYITSVFMKGECGKIELKVGDYFERFSQNCVYFCGWVIYGSVCISDDA